MSWRMRTRKARIGAGREGPRGHAGKLPGDHPVILTSFEIAMRDRKKLAQLHYKYLVVDEGHRLKNAECRLARELRMITADNKLLLTGAPLARSPACPLARSRARPAVFAPCLVSPRLHVPRPHSSALCGWPAALTICKRGAAYAGQSPPRHVGGEPGRFAASASLGAEVALRFAANAPG